MERALLPRRSRGFTLIELLVVLGIMALMLALLPPFLPTVLDGQKVKAAARELAAGLRGARGQAVATQKEIALELDVEAKRYAVGERVRTLDLPRDTNISLRTTFTEQLSTHSGSIRFYPDGSATGGTISLARGSSSFVVEVAWLTGRVTVLE